MKTHYDCLMGPPNALIKDWFEVSLPYVGNQNEEELDLNPEYQGPKPSWAIWDWLEAVVPDMHDDVNGSVGWWINGESFLFMFRQPRHAAMFILRFEGKWQRL